MTDLRHDEPCSSPRSDSGLPVDTATLTERVEAALNMASVYTPRDTGRQELVRDGLAALLSLETQLEESERQRISVALKAMQIEARAADAERQSVAAEAREKALSEALEAAREDFFTVYRAGFDSTRAALANDAIDKIDRALVGVRGEEKEVGLTPIQANSGDEQSSSSGGTS